MIKILKPQRLVNSTNCHQNYHSLQLALPNFRSEQSSNDYISSLCKQNLFNQAIQAFDYFQTQTPDFRIWPSTYAHLFSACSSLRSLRHGRRVHDHLLRMGSQPADVILHNHILNMYGKCGSLEDARNVFDKMLERNLVSWTSMISGYSQNRRERDAIDLYLEMQRVGVVPDQFAFGSVIRSSAGLNSLELGKQLHANVIKSECGLELIAQNALVAMYTKFDRIDDASVVFERIVTKDIIAWGSMITGFAKQGCEVEALRLFKQMISIGAHCPNESIFGSVFSACSSIFKLEYGRQIHSMSIKFGLGRDAFAGCAVSDMYAKCGCLESARTAFYQIEMPDLVSWNAITAGFAYGGEANEAMKFFSQMRHSGLTPDEITIRGLLCAFTSSVSLSQGQQVHSFVTKTGIDSDVPVCNTLLTMYAKCSDLRHVFNMFGEMASSMDIVSWNAILTACLKHNEANEVIRLFKLMHTSQQKPNEITLSNVLGACSNLTSLEMGYQVHGYSMKTGYEIDSLVMNGLIDMYTKCGALVNARELFESMSNPDVISWSSLIVGYAQFGYGEEALKLFRTMTTMGVMPNQVTFVGVLSACSRVGLVEEGCHYYKTMETDHGVMPTLEHCSCVVDLLARAGRLEEAERFINQMPFDPDIIVWKTLLAACRTQGNLEIGKRAAESILKLDESSSAAHVLLCNIYASTGSWDDVARVRKLMRTRGVRKVPGQSWIEVREGVHVFMVEDRSHPKIGEIYSLLEDLRLQMIEAGYVPDRKYASSDQLND